jgi:integrase
MIEALRRLNSGQFVDPGRLTVGVFLEQWIEAVVPGLRESTAASHRMVLTKRVMPPIGELRLASLTPGHLNAMYADLVARGGRFGRPLSSRSVRYSHTIVGRALPDAVATTVGGRRWSMASVRSASPSDPSSAR